MLSKQDYYDARKLHKLGKDGASAIVHQEQKNSILSQIHRIVGPFILRRKKAEVDNTILPKKEVMVYCPMTLLQRQQYQTFKRILSQDKKWAAGRQCLGSALGPGFQFQYLMVSTRLLIPYYVNYMDMVLRTLAMLAITPISKGRGLRRSRWDIWIPTERLSNQHI